MQVWIGTAGYAYPAWADGFYPPGTPAGEQLGYYASQFPMVEINSTFYRPPTIEQVERMLARVPAGFQFTLKVPKSASHDGVSGELAAFAEAAWAVGDRLLGLVVQFPEAFRNYRPERERLVAIRQALTGFPLAVEFRHISWDVSGLPRWLADHGLTCVSVGVPDLPTLFQAGLRVYGERVYARLHSRNPDAWYAGGAARYDYDYPDADLIALATGLASAAEQGVQEAVIVFNNCVGVQAVQNARRLAGLLRGRSEVQVMEPPERPRVPTLFDEV